MAYYLHTRQVQLRGSNKMQTIYYFARMEGDGGLGQVPGGFGVVENTRTGLPFLKKK